MQSPQDGAATPGAERPLVSRLTLELVVAAFLFGVGAAVVAGGLEYKIGWDESGPQPGYFPFYVGLVIMLGALGSGIQAWLHGRDRHEVLLTHEQFRRVGTFFGPAVLFVLACGFLGIYVAMALYLVFTTRLLGGYGWPKAVAIGVGTALVFFVLFEFLFGQPLLKGPLEELLGFG